MCGYFMRCYAAIFLHNGFNCCWSLVSLLGVPDLVEESLLQN